MTVTIRDFDSARDDAAARSFVDGSQAWEHPIEPDRRVDGEVAGDWWAVLQQRVAAGRGHIFVADQDGRAVGWGIFLVEPHPVYVIESERDAGYIVELFVEAGLRGQGIGQRLIAACEDEARRLGLSHIMIGVLAGNTRAADLYVHAGYRPYQIELTKRL